MLALKASGNKRMITIKKGRVYLLKYADFKGRLKSKTISGDELINISYPELLKICGIRKLFLISLTKKQIKPGLTGQNF